MVGTCSCASRSNTKRTKSAVKKERTTRPTKEIKHTRPEQFLEQPHNRNLFQRLTLFLIVIFTQHHKHPLSTPLDTPFLETNNSWQMPLNALSFALVFKHWLSIPFQVFGVSNLVLLLRIQVYSQCDTFLSTSQTWIQAERAISICSCCEQNQSSVCWSTARALLPFQHHFTNYLLDLHGHWLLCKRNKSSRALPFTLSMTTTPFFKQTSNIWPSAQSFSSGPEFTSSLYSVTAQWRVTEYYRDAHNCPEITPVLL